MFLDGIIGEMGKSVVDIVKVVFLVGKSKVALLIKPNFRRIEVLNNNPLPDIELPALND